jgi:hypothetical protein
MEKEEKIKYGCGNKEFNIIKRSVYQQQQTNQSKNKTNQFKTYKKPTDVKMRVSIRGAKRRSKNKKQNNQNLTITTQQSTKNLQM